MVFSSRISAYSIMTTASLPAGSIPPVGILAASPGRREKSGVRPMMTSPLTVRKAGLPSEAPNVSLARTAKPSIVAREKGGRSS